MLGVELMGCVAHEMKLGRISVTDVMGALEVLIFMNVLKRKVQKMLYIFVHVLYITNHKNLSVYCWSLNHTSSCSRMS